MKSERVVNNIQQQLKNYIVKSNLKSLVLGVSGGIDSTLCAALAWPVCEELKIPLIGRSLPTSTNGGDEISRAFEVGQTFCHDFSEIDITGTFKQLEEETDLSSGALTLTDHQRNVRRGNLKARIRMCHLFDLAGATGGMVLSTDNYTEYLLSFFTNHGDVGDYGMIQNLFKTEVYELTEYLTDFWLKKDEEPGRIPHIKKAEALHHGVEAIPTDGLGVSKTDLDQILPDWRERHTNCRSGYYEVDCILKTWLCDDQDSYYYDDVYKFNERPKVWSEFEIYRKKLENNPVVLRHLRTEFKRKVPINLTRESLEIL
jgi:NAD+ synthetase